MTLRCPACGKINHRAAGTACQRCGCDHTLLYAVVYHAHWHLAEAGAQFRVRDWEAALCHAERSWQLLHTADAAQLAVLAATALGDSASAFRWLFHARQSANAGTAS